MEQDVTAGEEYVRRFHPARIVEHWVHVLFFVTLVSTGLSQRFYMFDISQWFIMLLGGIDNVRIVHRVAGILLSLAIVIHIAVAVRGVVYKKWKLTMVITRKDVADAIHTIRYYLGLEIAPAEEGRYTYKQKFEYWAILTGVLIMMVTGFILWFPVMITKVMPGEIIPAAKVLHANEALVVFLIIAVWHVYNAIFSPEVFPLDTSIFTGRLSKERMQQEHPLELAEDMGRHET
jgi:formate dehydrogenase subunit gamma